jgi:MYXO-CTERM domain-containing protein
MARVTTALRFSLIAAILAVVPAMKPAAPPAPEAPVFNQSVAADSYGYKWIDNQGADDPAAGGSGPDFQTIFQDISSTGTVLSALSCDDCTTTFQPPMLVRYYGSNWGQAPAGSGAQVVSASIVASSNGTVQFLNSGQSANASYSNVQLPANGMNGMVAFMWDDCYGASAGNSARWEVVGSAPNRRLLIQSTSWDWCCSDGPNMQYQVQFTESDGTADSTIYLVYSDITNSDGRECGNSATIGIQSPTLSAYSQYSLNVASLQDNRVIRFYTNQNPNPPTNLSQAADPGGATKPLGFVSDATAYFRASGTDPDVSNTMGIQVEVLPSAVPFDPVAITGQTAQTPAGSLVPQGQVAEALFTFGNPYGSGDYHWRARMIDNAGGTSSWVLFNAASVHLTVDLTPPGLPAGPFSPPEGGSVGVTPPAGDILFQWGPATDIGPPGPLTYRFQVSASPGFATALADETLAGLEFRVPLEISANPYFWRVAAIDQSGNQGPYTPAMSFLAIFEDGVNHGGGDCNISVGSAAGPLVPAALAALLLAFGATRRRRS